jgi:hypothetical protein
MTIFCTGAALHFARANIYDQNFSFRASMFKLSLVAMSNRANDSPKPVADQFQPWRPQVPTRRESYGQNLAG